MSYMFMFAIVVKQCHHPYINRIFRQSVLPDLDRINTIKELLGVKFGFISLPLFDVDQLDCMLDALCTE